MTCEFERTDGAYVLGALSPTERLAFERHLPQCADCRRSVRELAGLPGLLAQVSLDDLDPANQPPVPHTLQGALIDDIRRAQRRRSLVVAGIAASVAAGLVSAVAIGIAAQDSGGDATTPVASSVTSTAPTRAMTVLVHAPLEANVVVNSVPWGTRLDVTCAYGIEPGYPTNLPKVEYALVVRTVGGASERVATWWGVPGKTMQFSAATATARADITAVEMRTSDGTTVARLAM
ncbi:anti-sigma factor family protein [Kribbia dieselivorans]|uniref:anti-sigma factor family protein n=1 Tax=Kribbia dieselivorans TaxID=331526 RepID=UPI0008382A28|nr:zf-HC2 domain-containing protein [Kribbia dieselivorans]